MLQNQAIFRLAARAPGKTKEPLSGEIRFLRSCLERFSTPLASR